MSTFGRQDRFRRTQELTLPELAPEAFHGPAGAWAIASQPHTEASPAGVLICTLVAFGNAVGRSPYADVGAKRHHANEYALLVGSTSTARKGETMAVATLPIKHADEGWKGRLMGGFGSGESIVYELRDAKVDVDDDEQQHVVDAGAMDKRLLAYEPEFAHVFSVAGRDGSTLSSLLRNGWDSERLENRTKASSLVATDAHLSILAGITPGELLQRTTETDLLNGLMNRFLLVAVARLKLLPDPAPIPYSLIAEHASRFALALSSARRPTGLYRDADAARLWNAAYGSELSVDRGGLAGAVCSRAEAHALRLSMIYALLDRSDTIRVEHVEAALAVWRYCEESAYALFGKLLGDPDADRIEDALLQAGQAGMTRSQIRDLFSRNRSGDQLDRAIAELLDLGRVAVAQEETGGRPTTRYYHVDWGAP
jgi:hypothetical protein